MIGLSVASMSGLLANFTWSKVMSSNAVWEPNDLVTPRREMIVSPGWPAGPS